MTAIPEAIASPTSQPFRSVDRIRYSESGPSWSATKKPRPKPTENACMSASPIEQAACSFPLAVGHVCPRMFHDQCVALGTAAGAKAPQYAAVAEVEDLSSAAARDQLHI